MRPQPAPPAKKAKPPPAYVYTGPQSSVLVNLVTGGVYLGVVLGTWVALVTGADLLLSGEALPSPDALISSVGVRVGEERGAVHVCV